MKTLTITKHSGACLGPQEKCQICLNPEGWGKQGLRCTDACHPTHLLVPDYCGFKLIENPRLVDQDRIKW